MPDTSITITEKQLAIYEDKIKKGLASFFEVGQSLQRIKDANGFKLRGFDTFDAYCQKTFSFSERNGYRLIAAADTAKKVEKAVGEMPRNEASARVLKEVVHDPKLIERVNEKLKRAGQTMATATAERLQEIVDKVKPQTRPMFEEPKAPPKPVLPTLSDTCPICHQQPFNYARHEDGWHCGIAACNALVMVGVIPANAQACPECGAAILTTNAEFCETCGCILAVPA
jgi:hypothetical protein